ncbi:MAG TPA: hypothetical protein VGM56_18765 [Byssovorax sp.]
MPELRLARSTHIAAAPLPRAVIALAALAMAAIGCGHAATKDECEEIFTHNAAIELRSQNVIDPATVHKRTAEARAAKGDDFVHQCMGKKITDGAMTCIRSAESAAQFDKCLD